LTRLEKIVDKFEKKSILDKNWINSWVKIISKNLLLLAWSLFNKDANIAPLVRSFHEEFEVRVYIKREKKIKRIITTITNDIIDRARNIDVKAAFLVRKDIIIVRKQFDIVIFRIKIEKSKRILKKNNFWTKKILSNASLREANYDIIVYKIKVESILKNIEKNDAKTFIKINNCLYLRVIIDKTK